MFDTTENFVIVSWSTGIKLLKSMLLKMPAATASESVLILKTSRNDILSSPYTPEYTHRAMQECVWITQKPLLSVPGCLQSACVPHADVYAPGGRLIIL